ncbi:MAG: hypothetical protein JWN15_3645 [Firmicutes bacterium]|nr:hypothetical protein [Bacillota bacterium]
MKRLLVVPATGLRILLGAGIWMAGNLFFYKLYVMLPYRIPPTLNVLILFFPVIPAALAHAWAYLDVAASGTLRTGLTLVALVAWAAFIAYFVVYTHSF